MVDPEELQIRQNARLSPVQGDLPTYEQTPFVTVEPGEKVIFRFIPLNDQILFLKWTEERFNPDTLYEWFFDGEKVDSGQDVHQSLGDQQVQYYPPEMITSEVRIEISNLGTTADVYAVRFGGWQRQKDKQLNGTQVGTELL